jgi:hypothetical protein
MTRHRRLLLGGLLAGLVVVYLVRRHRAKQQETQATTNAFVGQPFVAIPASFSYIRDNAAPPPGSDPVALNNAGIALLNQLTNALTSQVTRSGIPATVSVSPSAAGPSYVPHPITLAGRTYMGQLTEGGKGETEFFSTKSQAVGGVLEWKGPGHYTRVKLPGDPGGGRDTEWIFAGA